MTKFKNPTNIDSLQSQTAEEIILQTKAINANPWGNVYWFARMLLNSDQYYGIGKDNARVEEAGSSISTFLNSNVKEPRSQVIPIIHEIIRKTFLDGKKDGTKVKRGIEKFVIDVNELIKTKKDALVFSFTCSKVVYMTNIALDKVPSNDKEFTEVIGKSILDVQGAKGLKILINTWDDLGVKGCLDAERAQVLNVFRIIQKDLKTIKKIKKKDIDLTLTALVQEMERRLGQKRKGRGGRSLEDVTSLILDNFGFDSCPAPSHFQADIEVDKWIKTKRGFYVGISCKRTLRERWKQVSSADAASMGRYKISAFLHVITYSKDLTDDKLALLGGHGHIFYLPDDDPNLKNHLTHPTLSKFVKPMSGFVDDLRASIKNG